MTRRTVSLLVLAAAFVLLLWVAPEVPLVVFAGVLVAVFLRGSGNWIAHRLGLAERWGLTLFCLLLLALAASFFLVAGAALADQFNQLWQRLPEAVSAVRAYVEGHEWLRKLFQSVDLQAMMRSGFEAVGTVTTTFGALAGLVVIFFIGLYGAIDPRLYIRGAVLLVAPSLRPRAEQMLMEAGIALAGWMRAQFVAMTAIGVLTGLGLWLLDMPLALVLAVLAAVLTFIPNIGPLAAAVPAVLLALSMGVSNALWVAALYVVVETLEGYFITPRVQQEAVSLPPALTISFQFLFGLLFGVLGLALATPFAAMTLRLTQKFYVGVYLDREEAGPAIA